MPGLALAVAACAFGVSAELSVVGSTLEAAPGDNVAMLWPADGSLEPALTILDVEGHAGAEAYGPVFFDQPLPTGGLMVKGATIEALIMGAPEFPPIDGLPEIAWKDKQCSDCHQWQRANLCEQGAHYGGSRGSAALTKKHPYGGSFKRNLMVWAEGGCQ